MSEIIIEPVEIPNLCSLRRLRRTRLRVLSGQKTTLKKSRHLTRFENNSSLFLF